MKKVDPIDDYLKPYCLRCDQKTGFKRGFVERKTRIGHRPYLIGRCTQCNGVVSVFLPSDRLPTKHNVVVDGQHLAALQEASEALGMPMREIVEKLLDQHLSDFVELETTLLDWAGLSPDEVQNPGWKSRWPGKLGRLFSSTVM